MKHVVVYGPPACGKTRNGKAIAKAYGCRNIKDGPDHLDLSGRRAHSIKTLFLVTAENRHTVLAGGVDPRAFEIVPFSEAMQMVGECA